jgi:hypothetical protein
MSTDTSGECGEEYCCYYEMASSAIGVLPIRWSSGELKIPPTSSYVSSAKWEPVSTVTMQRCSALRLNLSTSRVLTGPASRSCQVPGFRLVSTGGRPYEPPREGRDSNLRHQREVQEKQEQKERPQANPVASGTGESWLTQQRQRASRPVDETGHRLRESSSDELVRLAREQPEPHQGPASS